MPMTPEAKSALRATIRALRTRLLDDLHNSTESTYRMKVPAHSAGLSAALRIRRGRLEQWMDEQVRAQGAARQPRMREDFRREAEKQAAYTWLNRILILRLMEAVPRADGKPLRPPVVSAGWESQGYKDFREVAPALVRGDDSEGYAFLLQLVFEDLAQELPGLYGPAGVADLIPMAPATLRHLVDALKQPVLASCWSDDMTLGWVYQYWNDPEREALDAKLNAGGKLAPHEIASKTQMFTERYMVDWLLQNSLGPMWLAMCKKHGWTPEVQADGTLDRLEARRVDWRARRAAGEVPLTELMPLHTDAERRWAYYLPQPIPDDAVAHAPASVRELKIIDPAVGSGHFLVIALDLLLALYREEARHCGEAGEERWTDRAIVERILEHNLHGIDLDPRAVQIAAAALWLKARQVAPDMQPRRLNLVASNLRLASLADDDPALLELRRAVERETGIPGELTLSLVHALRGADHLGSLLKIDHAVEEALDRHERAGQVLLKDAQLTLFGGNQQPPKVFPHGRAVIRSTLRQQLEDFLTRHTGSDDLGLRLRGEQLAAGVRFVRLLREGNYDLVVANPPYQGTAKMADSGYLEQRYPLGKADLYAAFLLRGLELVRVGGFAAQVSMNGWMFLKQYAGLRNFVLGEHSVRSVVDLLWCAFEQMRHSTVAMYCLMRGEGKGAKSVGLVPTPRDEREESIPALDRKRAATLCHERRHTFDPGALKVVPGWPVVYWWTPDFLREYERAGKIQEVAPIRQGIATANDNRFLRSWWETGFRLSEMWSVFPDDSTVFQNYFRSRWVPAVGGADGVVWVEELRQVIRWEFNGIELANFRGARYGRGAAFYFCRGVAFTTIGNQLGGRLHRYPSVITSTGCSLYSDDTADLLCTLNSQKAHFVASSLNPTIHFINWDIERLPIYKLTFAGKIKDLVSRKFGERECCRETSIEFKRPGPSPWRHAQEWAQAAVDRPDAPLPEYIEQLDPEPATDHLSYALGVALGRFGPNGEGIFDPARDELRHALPAGILFLDGTLEGDDRRDSLGHPACAPLHAAWAAHGGDIALRKTLREWLARDFFKDVHKPMYENRPIHWPLSSSGKTFVAWINIHRWNAQTLRVLLADHLEPLRRRLDGELADVRAARDGTADKKAARAAERRHDQLLGAREELAAFIADVEQCADRGPPSADGCRARDQDARYAPELDDGVMINSAALWPLLEPQWRDPRKWWKELANAQGRKDYDWSHLSMRYWPNRVDNKCKGDPSLAVAHGCFWRYHPARAWTWELRLQDEISPDFRITEAPYRAGGQDLGDPGDGPHRDTWLREHPTEALAAVEKEAIRRMGRGSKRKPVPEMHILEAGLWSAIPHAVWDMELRLIEKQGTDFQLRSPDEAPGRTLLTEESPQFVVWRQQRLRELEAQSDLLVSDDVESEEGPSEDDELSESQGEEAG